MIHHGKPDVTLHQIFNHRSQSCAFMQVFDNKLVGYLGMMATVGAYSKQCAINAVEEELQQKEQATKVILSQPDCISTAFTRFVPNKEFRAECSRHKQRNPKN